MACSTNDRENGQHRLVEMSSTADFGQTASSKMVSDSTSLQYKCTVHLWKAIYSVNRHLCYHMINTSLTRIYRCMGYSHTLKYSKLKRFLFIDGRIINADRLHVLLSNRLNRFRSNVLYQKRCIRRLGHSFAGTNATSLEANGTIDGT